MKQRLAILMVTALLIGLFIPDVLTPFPCFKEPCTAGVNCFRGVPKCDSAVKGGDDDDDTGTTTINVSTEFIAAAIASVLHGGE